MTNVTEGEFQSFSSVTIGGEGPGRTFNFDEWSPDPLEDDREIWRYRSLKRYISILDLESLWFARPDQFNDPYEGTLPRKNRKERAANYDQSIKEARQDFRRRYRYLVYLNCWYSEEHESDAMWRLYAKEGDCLAIKSSPERLRIALEHSEDATFGKVQYRNFDSFKIDTDCPFAPLYFKRNAFNFESEYRVLLHYTRFSNGTSSTGLQDFQPDGVPVSVDIEDLIQEVVISPTSSDEFIEIVKSVTDQYGYSFDIRKSDMLEGGHF